jgi:hypothetical protein
LSLSDDHELAQAIVVISAVLGEHNTKKN